MDVYRRIISPSPSLNLSSEPDWTVALNEDIDIHFGLSMWTNSSYISTARKKDTRLGIKEDWALRLKQSLLQASYP